MIFGQPFVSDFFFGNLPAHKFAPLFKISGLQGWAGTQDYVRVVKNSRRAQSGVDLDAMVKLVEDNRRIGAHIIKEREYYASMTSSGAPLEVLGMAIATIMAIGSGFGAMNTMYAAVARRGREIAYSLVDEHVAHIVRDAVSHAREGS